MRTPIQVFLPSFVELRKTKVTKMMRGILTDKLVFSPFSRAPGAISPKILQGHSFPLLVPLPSIVQIHPVSGKTQICHSKAA